ncbi:hypothetical protein MMIN_04910 [Mycolicibacter minnesotensis]|nr:hypothetical protein MMIN_04910 [Mycolicibacter minnesotensis]
MVKVVPPARPWVKAAYSDTTVRPVPPVMVGLVARQSATALPAGPAAKALTLSREVPRATAVRVVRRVESGVKAAQEAMVAQATTLKAKQPEALAAMAALGVLPPATLVPVV